MLKMLSFFSQHLSENVAIPCHGFGKIKRHIDGYNKAARYNPFFVLTDLDTYDCAPALIREWLPCEQNSQLLFRVAVHEIESWLLADKDAFANYFSVNRAIIPLSPDELSDPKKTLLDLVKKSKKRHLRDAIVPIDEYASIGPGYNVEMELYIQDHWNIDNARQLSPSLNKAMRALENLAKQDIPVMEHK
jgi:hypothetical protein